MDNPQHYQPLSHALHPPLVPSQSRSPYPPSSVTYTPPSKPASVPSNMHREEEQEEEEQDDDDEGVVEGQLEPNENEGDRQESAPASPPRSNLALGGHVQSSLQIVHDTSHTGENKRRPGRPRGSKNRKPRAPHGVRESQPAQGAPSGPPPHPEINSQNQQYYEFQWRILNLCAEFYGAAEELVKGTNPLVISQCYHMGPGAKLDPLIMLAEAKRNCDSLLANPSQLVANPPPPIYPVLPTLYSSGSSAPGTSANQSATAPSGSVITNAQSFVVPLGSQPNYPAPQYPVYATGQYPTTPYYQYPYPHPGYYPPPPPPPPPIPSSGSGGGSGASGSAQPLQPQVSITSNPAAVLAITGHSGAWTEDEVEKLRGLAEDSKTVSGTGEIDWEHVISHFGNSRTRHQILIKATTMGMKESSTRGTKRRRENDTAEPSNTSTSNNANSNAAAGASSSPAMSSLPTQPQPPPQHQQQLQPGLQNTSSPSQSHATPTPHASPSLQNIQRPSSSSATAKGVASSAPSTSNNNNSAANASASPWPVVATAGSTTPATNTNVNDQQRTSYYRPRPNQTSGGADAGGSKTGSSGGAAGAVGVSVVLPHHYMYTPSNGRGADSR